MIYVIVYIFYRFHVFMLRLVNDSAHNLGKVA